MIRSFFKHFFKKQQETPKEGQLVKYLIIGLGNIGAEYENMRHNIGFDVLDALARQEGCSFRSDQLGSIAEFRHKGRLIYLLKPSTYMNLSGKAVRHWISKLKIADHHWLVVVDELQFEIGVFKLLKKGSAGGHNGLKSIEDSMQTTNYPRLRIGIGRDFRPGQQVNYVLSRWTAEQWDQMQPVIQSACDLIRSFASVGLDQTMNLYNKRKDLSK
jgi:peptidyl-tRNA hydrolase, PTH1 family